MSGLSSLQGFVTVYITSADLSATLEAINRQGIRTLHCILRSELEAELIVSRGQFRKLRSICEKRGDTLKLKGKSGAYWTLKAFLTRPVLTAGAVFFLLATLFLSSRVFFVQVTGNNVVPDRLILEAAADCGIGFGASRRGVRSERVKNALLEAVPELQWAGVNTHGCVAQISVRERALERENAPESAFGHIVASRDGVITTCNAIRGSLLCSPGQAVSAGDILISGYTDCGLSIRAEQAEGEIFAITSREIYIVIPDSCRSASKTGERKKKISLLIGKKRINLWKDSGIWDTTCDRMYEEYYITLPGGFQLPVGWSVERYDIRSVSPANVDADKSQQLLVEAAEKYLKSQMLAGFIRDTEVIHQECDGILQMTGQYSCVEMIGFMQRLEIGDTNGEDN